MWGRVVSPMTVSETYKLEQEIKRLTNEYAKCLKLVVENKEKAEKWDESLEYRPCGTLLFQTVYKLEQENKQLKEKADKWDEHDKEYCDLKEWRDNNKKLEQENKRLKQNAQTDEDIRSNDLAMINNYKAQIEESNEMWKEPDTNKEIVQKLRKFIKLSPESNHYTAIKEILGDKK